MGQQPTLNLDTELFLSRYWQREPLLIRSAVNDFSAPLCQNELAGLAMEADVESRIIEQRDDTWLLHHGPFDAPDFDRPGAWTLLVQAVDHYSHEVAALRQLVNFIPQWRVDDVMVSYAKNGGSVGPHYDNYDVFLLQGEGDRLWRVGNYCDSDAALQPHDELRILADFETQQEYLLHPGDILYLPPRVAHWGIARGECTTFSIGFRAPRLNDMVSRWADQLLEQLDPEEFFHDARMSPATRAGEIRPRDRERARAQLQAALDQTSSDTWFGELVTEPRYESMPDEDMLEYARERLLHGAERLQLSAAAKLAWQQEDNTIVIFANGDSQRYPDTVLPVIMHLCATGELQNSMLSEAMASAPAQQLVHDLLGRGCLYVE
tara:strand:- start:9933 stop:11066 length:1134 start_codon:yes stop_codon:yes gene_type:complete